MAVAKHAAGDLVVRPVAAAAMEVVKEAEGYKLHLATRSDSTTGYLNVSKMASGHFNAVRMVDGKTVYLGSYNTAVEAAVAVARYEAGEEVVRPAAAAATAVEVKEAEGYHLYLITSPVTRPAILA